jgi:hypothetical protein
MKNETAMTEKQAQKLRNAYEGRAKLKVIMVANPNSIIIQILGGLVLALNNRLITRLERKLGTSV